MSTAAEAAQDAPQAVEVELQAEPEHGAREDSHARVSERERGARSMKEDAPPEVTLDFCDIVYDVMAGLPGEAPAKKRILHGISGRVRPGEMMAIMGPTGAGKSSLLNILASQQEGQYEGTVLLNGRRRTKAMKRFLAYVLQDDTFFANLTVRETLTFSALLRLPSTLTFEQKRRRVDRVLRMLNIEKAADTKVGGMFMRGISGGERRRLNIGTEVITNPSLLLCDEPTSGLDSATAHAVVDTLVDMAHAGRSVAITIHQPSSMMFRKFDSLLLLAEGRTIYYGPAAGAADYFERQGFPCPRSFNIADHMLELVTSEQLQGGSAKIGPLAQAYAREAAPAGAPLLEGPGLDGDGDGAGAGRMVEVDLEAAAGSSQTALDVPGKGPAAATAAGGDALAEEGGGRWAVPFWDQFRVLLHRAYLQTRGERIQGLYLFQHLTMALICGLVWFRMERTEEELQNRLGAVFFITVFFNFQGLFNALTAFPAERPVVAKERASGSYRLSAYFVSRSLAEVPIEAMYPTLFMVVAYWLCGLNESFGRFLAFWAAIQLAQLAAAGIGLWISCTVMDFKKSLVYASVLMLGFMLTGSFYSRADTMPDYIRWVQHLSPVKYAYSLTSQIEFRGETFSCATPSAFAVCEAGSATFSGEAVLARDTLDELSPAGNAAILLAIGVVSRYGAYMGLRNK